MVYWLSPVLPPISTDGMTSDDVNLLAESTRELMLSTLKSISQPSRSSSTSHKLSSITSTSDDMADTPVEAQKRSSTTREAALKREGEESEEDEGRTGGSEMSKVDSRGGETTEDEMDDDAVLLKRPAGT